MKILLAVDGSEFSKKAVEFLLSRPELMQWERVVALNVQEEISDRVRGAIGVVKCRQMQEEAFAKEMAANAELMRSKGIEFEEIMAIGSPAAAIAREAKNRGCEMIVMGTHGYGVVGRLVMGSVAQGVVRSSSVPVLLVK